MCISQNNGIASTIIYYKHNLRTGRNDLGKVRVPGVPSDIANKTAIPITAIKPEIKII